MKKSRILPGIIYGFAILVLILDNKTALQGAREGLQLCMKTVIPSLFPFLLITIQITSGSSILHIPGENYLIRILGMPYGSVCYLIPSFLGGYPVGAKCVADGYRSGVLSKQDAHRLLGFASNAGPAFIFGIGAALFENRLIPWILWIIHIIAAIITAIALPRHPGNLMKRNQANQISLTEAMERSVKTMGLICGWVIIFRVVLCFVQRWFLWILPSYIQLIVAGLLELSNGCIDSASISSGADRFVILSFILGFGGICVLLQTLSATKGLGLGMYVPGKLLQGSISLLLTWLISPALFQYSITLPIIILYIAIILGAGVLAFVYRKKTVAIYESVMYNVKKRSRERKYAVSKKASQSL